MSKKYTSIQKEILCNLDLGNDQNAVAWQKKLAGKLADQIENDVENTLYNPEKINKYRAQAGLPPTENKSHLNTENIQTALGWFTSVRLFTVRLNGILKFFRLGFLPKIFDFLGLSYLLELIVDIVDIVGSTFFVPLRPQEKQLIQENKASRAKIYWYRFKNKMTQDEDLIPRMLNAAVWFSINLTAFILTGGFSSIVLAPAVTKLVSNLNIGGFIFDFLHEVGKGVKDFWQHSKTLNVIQDELKDLTDKQNQLIAEKHSYEKANQTNTNDYKKVQEKCKKIESKILSRQTFKKKLEEKIDLSLIPTRIYNWGVTVVIGFGMGLVSGVSQASIAAGRFMAFVGGSIFGGLGRRIWNKFVAPTLDRAKKAIFPPPLPLPLATTTEIKSNFTPIQTSGLLRNTSQPIVIPKNRTSIDIDQGPKSLEPNTMPHLPTGNNDRQQRLLSSSLPNIKQGQSRKNAFYFKFSAHEDCVDRKNDKKPQAQLENRLDNLENEAGFNNSLSFSR